MNCSHDLRLLSVLVGALALSACGGDDGADGVSGQSALIQVSAEAAGSNCGAGGSMVQAGLDTNGDGQLQAGEVTQTRFVCNGAAGGSGSTGATGPTGSTGATGPSGAQGVAALLNVTAEPAGAHCAAGGSRVDAGADTNGNGTLDSGEVTATSYVCNGTETAWVTVTGTTQAMASNRSYVATNAAQVTFSLPASPAVGDTVAVTGAGAEGWKIAQSAGQLIVAADGTPLTAVEASWADSASPSIGWNPIAADGTGTRVYAASGAGIHASTDGGQTWTLSLSMAAGWRSIAVSPDGRTVVASSAGGDLQRSDDAGANWYALTAPAPSDLERIGMSADGQTLLVAEDVSTTGSVWLSVDGGNSFNAVTGLPAGGTWVSASVSRDGSVLVATQNATLPGNRTVLSADGGGSWTTLTTPARMHAVVVSGDGSTLVGITENSSTNTVYVSKDLGATWVARKAIGLFGNGNLLRVAVSDDGKVIAAATYAGRTHVSFNAGLDWGIGSAYGEWYGITVAGDGKKVLAALGGATSGPIQIATPTAKSRSTAGVSGYITGTQYTGASLQYVGGNTWMVKSVSGTVFAH